MSYASYDHPDPRKAAMTLGDFLSMSSGLDCNDHSSTSPGREKVIDDKPDWVKATLDLPMINDPGTAGFYCSGGVAVVGRMTENAVHMKLPEFAQANLFGPLGIARTDWTWNYDLTNDDKEYSQIHLRPRDMLKLGILFADGGRWHGQQIMSESWVRTSLAEHSHVDDVSYGYFWWRHAFECEDGHAARSRLLFRRRRATADKRSSSCRSTIWSPFSRRADTTRTRLRRTRSWRRLFCRD